MKQHDFQALVDLAMRQPGVVAMRPVIEKEILHYDIFSALDRAGLLKGLVFQGGTSLRLCRGSNRYSEDLDFAGGVDFDTNAMLEMKECIEMHIGERYGLKVSVREPQSLTRDEAADDNVTVDRWLVAVETAPANRAMPQQRIKVEVANIPAYTRELVPLRANYDFYAGVGEVLVPTESVSEVLADKVLAYPTSVASPAGEPYPPSSRRIRYRDIWDLAWLLGRRATLDPEMVLQKATDYGVANYPLLLARAIESLPAVINSPDFFAQMSRFIDADTLRRTLASPDYLRYLETEVGGLLDGMQKHILSAQPPAPRPRGREHL